MDEILKNMKASDKARAFDMIVEACVTKQSEDPGKDVMNILQWCNDWFRE